MRTACLVGATVIVAALIGCGSEATQSPTGGTSSTTSSGSGTGGGTTTSSAGGAGGMGQGGNGAGGAGGSMACEALPDPCGQCLYADCQGAYCNCYANQECVGLLTCLQGCTPGDMMCTDNCAAMYPSGIAEAALLGGCSDQNCQPACPPSGLMLGACETCLFMSCSNEMNACLADADCSAILQCAQMCPPGDMGCPGDCAAMYPGGIQEAGAVAQCMTNNCAMDCQ